ncbi:MAG: PLP-dependent aspartate aminotransferase family protein [Defluviitaleaceae bacterium]|nr:PLP-dependent aspartate aminotransferase family protein [Defluviitaleaceae bacterium]MCL2273907.1 PLP-dependent aspartate aminotransferase family protein [Defluviitaleaceae bacterium]
MKKDTLCIHGYKHKTDKTGAITVPIFQASTFVYPEVNANAPYCYTRLQNPTREAAEETVAALEGAKEGFAFASGMAAIMTVMELIPPNSHVIATEDLYGGSIRLFNTVCINRNIEFDYVDTADIAAIQAKIKPNTRAVYVESPTNPMIQITDIPAVKTAIQGLDILLIADNTFLTPYYMNPLALGADIVIHSGTKYLGGHSDTLAGFAVLNDDALRTRLRTLHKSIGACLSPFDSFLIIRGIKTLALRMDKAQANAMAIAEWLSAQPKITSVNYAGLPTHKGHEILKKQARGFGAMISFETDTPQTAREILNRVSIISYAESLGCVNTLITIPTLCTHEDVPPEEREARGISDRLLRLSVGIENAEDLIEDLRQAIG